MTVIEMKRPEEEVRAELRTVVNKAGFFYDNEFAPRKHSKQMTYEDVANTRRKFFWDVVDHDKYEILERYGTPMCMLLVTRLSTGEKFIITLERELRRLSLTKHDTTKQ